MNEPKARKVSHKGSRQKGARGEYKVRDDLIKIGITAKRVPMSGALSWFKGDVTEMNVVNKHIHEVKNHETLSLGEWWRQASVQALYNEVPTLEFMSNHYPIYSVMRATDFDQMVAEYEASRSELRLNLIDFPPRKNFWKWQAATKTGGLDIYFWELKGRTIVEKDVAVVYPDEQLIIFPFSLYLMIRKYQVVLT